MKQEAPSTSCAKLQRPAHRHCTRGQENSFRPFLANNHAGLVSFSNCAPLVWNSLPVDVREAPSPSSFKRRLLNILKEPCNLNKLSNIVLTTLPSFSRGSVLFCLYSVPRVLLSCTCITFSSTTATADCKLYCPHFLLSFFFFIYFFKYYLFFFFIVGSL